MALIIDMNKPQGDSYVAADNKALNEDIRHLEVILDNSEHEWACEECKQDHIRLLQYLKELRAYRWAIKHAKEPEDIVEPLTIMVDYYENNKMYECAAAMSCAINLIKETFCELFDTEYIRKEKEN